MRGMQAGGSVVDFGELPDRIHSPGPNASHYEQFRSQAGAHLIFNAFWTIPHFCVHQMLMRDPMHQVDLGAIVHLIRAILRKFKECVETAWICLDSPLGNLGIDFGLCWRNDPLLAVKGDVLAF